MLSVWLVSSATAKVSLYRDQDVLLRNSQVLLTAELRSYARLEEVGR